MRTTTPNRLCIRLGRLLRSPRQPARPPGPGNRHHPRLVDLHQFCALRHPAPARLAPRQQAGGAGRAGSQPGHRLWRGHWLPLPHLAPLHAQTTKNLSATVSAVSLPLLPCALAPVKLRTYALSIESVLRADQANEGCVGTQIYYMDN